jgi:hypothetical protein
VDKSAHHRIDSQNPSTGVKISDIKQCFTCTPGAIGTGQQCVQHVPNLILEDISNFIKLKRLSAKAMNSNTRIMTKVSAVELKAYNSVASSIERASTNGQLQLNGTTHATTAAGVVKSTAVVQAELTVPSLREPGSPVTTSELGSINFTALIVHNPFNTPVWISVAQLAEPTANDSADMFRVIMRTDWHSSSGIVLYPNTTRTVASVSFMPTPGLTVVCTALAYTYGQTSHC